MKIADMPHSVREALINRGHDADQELSAREAMREWAAWHIGDGAWAENCIYLYEKIKEGGDA